MKARRLSKLILFFVLLLFTLAAFGQDFYIHDRGMLHQTVFNSGALGYSAHQSANHSRQTPYLLPAAEWPPYSYFETETEVYSGSHNMMGGGIQITAIPIDSTLRSAEQIWAVCTGYYDNNSAQTYNAVIIGHVFPISMEKINNYPVLEDGSLNGAYDPNESEQIITARFATVNGFDVTRISRQWSYPDYDDFIIYEYTLVFTGNTDNNPETIEMADSALKDVMVAFSEIMVPSRFGFDRNYGNWDPSVYSSGNPIHGSYQDHEYWITYNQNAKTLTNHNAAGMPEPDPDLFREWSETSKHGGGLLSHQAYGMGVLHMENDHRALVTRKFATSESQLWWWYIPEFPSLGPFDQIGEEMWLKRQPFQLFASPGYETPADMSLVNTSTGRGGPFFGLDGNDNFVWAPNYNWPPFEPWGDVAYPDHNTGQPLPPDWNSGNAMMDYWRGRNFIMEKRWSSGMPNQSIQFGPYKLDKGDTLNFTIVELIGFGTEDNKYLLGGELERDPSIYWDYVQDWNRRIENADGVLLTEAYVDEFGYPDHVNSDVVSIQDVAHKVWQAYLGVDSADITFPLMPDVTPITGQYHEMKIPFPAPGIKTENTPLAQARIVWTTEAEDVSSIIPSYRLLGDLASYNVYRSEGRVAWDLLATKVKGDLAESGRYEVVDPDVKIGDTFYYAVTSVDEHGNESGKTNMIQHGVQVGSAEELTDVYVVPNPFYIESDFSGASPAKIGFYNLPAPSTVRIYSLAGQLVETIEHTEDLYSHGYEQITFNNQRIASGVYFYLVSTPEGDTFKGKFIVVR